MAIRNQELKVNFLVWDTAGNHGKTGDAGGVTLNVVKDGRPPAGVTNAVYEVNPQTMPGIYGIELTANEMDGDFICVSGVSDSAGVVVYPAFIQTERGDLDAIATLLNQIINEMPEIPELPDNIASAEDVENAKTQIMANVDECKNAVAAADEKVNNVLTALDNILSAIDDIRGGVTLNGGGRTAVREEAAAGVKGITLSELNAMPSANTPTLPQALMLLYMALRNKSQNSEREYIIYKSNNETPFAKAGLYDKDNIFTREALT